MEKYRRLLLEDDREDGEIPEHLTACFRRDLRASLLLAMIRGTSASLNAAGLPKRFKPKAMAIVPPAPSRPNPSSPAQGSPEDSDVSRSSHSSESPSSSDCDSDTGSSETERDASNPCSAQHSTAPRRSSRIALQRPATPISLTPRYSLDMVDGFPLITSTCSAACSS